MSARASRSKSSVSYGRGDDGGGIPLGTAAGRGERLRCTGSGASSTAVLPTAMLTSRPFRSASTALPTAAASTAASAAAAASSSATAGGAVARDELGAQLLVA